MKAKPIWIAASLLLFSASFERPAPSASNLPVPLKFSAEIMIGNAGTNPSTPFLRYAPDGRLFAVWTEDHDRPSTHAKSLPDIM